MWQVKKLNVVDFLPVLLLSSIVSTYLVHHGYCATAESFARHTGQSFGEELTSIKNRQRKYIGFDIFDNFIVFY